MRNVSGSFYLKGFPPESVKEYLTSIQEIDSAVAGRREETGKVHFSIPATDEAVEVLVRGFRKLVNPENNKN